MTKYATVISWRGLSGIAQLICFEHGGLTSPTGTPSVTDLCSMNKREEVPWDSGSPPQSASFTLSNSHKSKGHGAGSQMFTLPKTHYTSWHEVDQKKKKQRWIFLPPPQCLEPSHSSLGTLFPKGSSPFWFCCKEGRTKGLAGKEIKEAPSPLILIFKTF